MKKNIAKNNTNLIDAINVDIIDNTKKGRIHSYFIERLGSSFLKFQFDNVNLPKNTFVEFDCGENFIQREFFYNGNKSSITIPNQSVCIRIVLPKNVNLDNYFSFTLNTVEYDNSSRVIIGEDERRPYMCYAGTDIAKHALSSAAAKIGGWGSCSSIGSENHILTNQHVTIKDPELTYGEIWFNWFNKSCNPSSQVNEPVRLKPGHMIKMGSSGGNDNDYALLSIDDFDYVNSQVKTLFGGLELSKFNPKVGEDIYIPQYGDGGLRPMYISDVNDGRNAKILAIENNGNKLTYNADTQGGSSGSPVISRGNNKIVGLHWGGGNVNIAVSAQKLNFEFGGFIEKSNNSVIGLGNVESYNLEKTPISLFEILIPIDMKKKGGIIPFDTVEIDDYDDFSIITVDSIDLITNETAPLKFRACLIKDGKQTNIHDDDITGEVLLKIYAIEICSEKLIKFWLTFKISDYMNNIKNYVIRTILDYYNAYEPPFDINDADILDFNFRKNEKKEINYIVNAKDDYGYVALYRGEGPLALEWSGSGYSKVKVLLKSMSGDEILVNLRGNRSTDCSIRTMNSAVACASTNKYSKFILTYHPEDNENLLLKDDVYEGIFPLQAQQWENQEGKKNILVNLKLGK